MKKKQSEKELNQIMMKIISDWKEDDIYFGIQNQREAYCYVKEREIYLNTRLYLNPTMKSVFDMLHEYGHIKTNTSKMKNCEEEYYATQWALDNLEKYGLIITSNIVELFQNYIWEWQEKDSKKNYKKLPSKNDLTLVWKG